MKKFLLGIASLVIVLVIVYLAGPKFPKPTLNNKLPDISLQTGEVESYVRNKESKLKIKPDNESRIIWANDSLKSKTAYCLLYLHGFAACWYEGNPVHLDFAHRYGMNLYAPLLASHGLDTPEPLLDMTPDHLYESAKEALVVAQSLGDKVILMGTSTGCTLGLKLAAEFPQLIDGLILLSPNIALFSPLGIIAAKPWGLQLGRYAFNGNYRTLKSKYPEECQYWNCKQRLEAGIYLQQLIEATMKKETFERVKTPVFMAYYYKDKAYQDSTVRVDAMLKMFDQLSTPEQLKVKEVFPEAGTHPIGCKLLSGAWQDIEKASFTFAEEKLGIKPISDVIN
jgi:pimeloyl-ACP methyl ester carboxylesterase